MPFLSFIACPDQRNNKKRSCEKIISHFFTAPFLLLMDRKNGMAVRKDRLEEKDRLEVGGKRLEKDAENFYKGYI